MSHTRRIKTKIKNAKSQFLKVAIETIAKKLGARTVDHVTDAYRNSTKVQFGLQTDELPRGLGFDIGNNGEIEVIGDSWQVHTAFNEVKRMVEQQYVAAATKSGLQSMGYMPVSQKTIGKRIEMVAVKAW